MFEKEIERGMEVLDSQLGPTWPLKIDASCLELMDPCQCVVGQLTGSFVLTLQRWGIWGNSDKLTDSRPSMYGFALPDECYDESNSPKPGMWNLLTEEWLIAIKTRIDAGIKL